MITQNDASSCPHRELAVGWALHALEPAEESLIVSHLPGCAECTRIVAETEQVGAMLGLSIPEESPNERLEQRVLAVTAVGAAAPVIPLVSPPQRASVDKKAWTRYRVLTAAASVVLVALSVALGVRVVQLDDQRDQARDQVAAISELMAQAADPATDQVRLLTEQDHSIGVVFAGLRQVTLLTTDLSANRREDQIYVLWGIPDTGRPSAVQIPQALFGFDVASDVPGWHTVRFAENSGEFVGYAVSLEPGRHLPSSPTTVIASGQVDS